MLILILILLFNQHSCQKQAYKTAIAEVPASFPFSTRTTTLLSEQLSAQQKDTDVLLQASHKLQAKQYLYFLAQCMHDLIQHCTVF